MATKPLDFADFAKISTSGDSVKLGQQEQHVLDLYDRLTELRLERALLEAQAHLGPGIHLSGVGSWTWTDDVRQRPPSQN